MKTRSAIAVLALAAAAARADTVALKDGRFVEGVKIEKAEAGYKLRYKNGDVLIPEEMVRDVLIEGEKGYEPRNEEEKAKLEQGLVPFQGSWIRKAERDAILAKREAETRRRIEEAKAHRLWRNRYITKTPHFQFEYTIDPEIFEDLKNLMETYYSVFTRQWGISAPQKLGRLKVCFYHDYDSFLQVGGAGWGVLGYYRFVAPLELNFFYDRSDPDFTIEVMFHEANHYLTHLVDLDFKYPHCINEAMAEYYGASRWDHAKKQMSTGHLLEGRLTEVLTDIQGGEWKKLENYLTNKLGYDDYTWGWTFVHFMMETPKYASRFKAFFLALARGKDVSRTAQGEMKTVEGDEILKAFKKYVGVRDLPALEKEWHNHIQQNMKLQTERGYEKAAIAALRTGQKLKAKRFFQMAVDKGSRSAKLYGEFAGLLRNEGKVDEAEKQLRKAIELDPLHASFYASLGRIYRSGDSEKRREEGTRLLLLAREIDPDNTDLWIDEELEKALKGKDKP